MQLKKRREKKSRSSIYQADSLAVLPETILESSIVVENESASTRFKFEDHREASSVADIKKTVINVV